MPVAFQIIDGNTETSISCIYGSEAEAAITKLAKAKGAKGFEKMLADGQMESVEFNGTTYFNLYI